MLYKSLSQNTKEVKSPESYNLPMKFQVTSKACLKDLYLRLMFPGRFA